MTLKMTSAQVVETSVIVNNNSSFQNYTNPDDHTQQTTHTPGFEPFTVNVIPLIELLMMMMMMMMMMIMMMIVHRVQFTVNLVHRVDHILYDFSTWLWVTS